MNTNQITGSTLPTASYVCPHPSRLHAILCCDFVILISLAATCRAPWVLSLQNGRVRTRPARGTIRKALKLAFEDNSTYQLASYMTEKS